MWILKIVTWIPGTLIDAKGVHVSPKSVEAILKMKAP